MTSSLNEGGTAVFRPSHDELVFSDVGMEDCDEDLPNEAKTIIPRPFFHD